MRDIAVTLAVFGSLPFILRRPWIGILVWTWLGFMNPHRLAWGFSTTMPFAMIVALTTLVAIMFSKEPKKLSREPGMVLMAVFLAWMLLTTFHAHYPALAWEQFNKVWKIFLMIFVATMVINNRQRLIALVWVIALSLGFYGVKGGIFTFLTGGGYHVQGPANTFIEGNNEMGLALVMTVPLLCFCYMSAKHQVVRIAFVGAVVLTILAALGTQSRGTLLGLAAMGAFLWLKSRNKIQIGILIIVAGFVLVPFMPESWVERMASIERYEEDGSAMSRLNAWGMAFNLASNEFLGGGFETFQEREFDRYAPDPTRQADAHSIYFEVLGEHGFPGLAIFLAIIAFTWFGASRVIRRCSGDSDLKWLADMMAMIQVSLVAYLTAGAFLGLAYFDYFYNLVLVVALAKGMLRNVPSEATHGEAGLDAAGPKQTQGIGSPATASTVMARSGRRVLANEGERSS